MEDPKQIDLSKSEYRAEGIKGEPFFSYGWPILGAALIMIGTAVLFHGAPFWVHVAGGIAGAAVAALFEQIFSGG